MKKSPPPPGWVDRLYRWGVGLAIPVTLIIGSALLLTAREQRSGVIPAGPVAPPATVLMALPIEEGVRSVQLQAAHAAPTAACPPAAGARADPHCRRDPTAGR